MEKPLLSIDLGQYYTKVFAADNKKSAVRRIKGQTSEYIPTMIGIIDGKRVIGNIAKSYAKSRPHSIITNIMYFVGINYRDDLQNYTKVEVTQNHGDSRILFHLKLEDNKTISLTVEDCLAYFIEGVMKHAGVERKDAKVVFTVPAWWQECRRQSLYDACRICGLEDFHFLDSCVAQCIDLHSRVGKIDNMNGLFIDIGELNTTIAHVTVNKDKFKILEYKHLQIGGLNITKAVSQYVERKINALKVGRAKLDKFINDSSEGGSIYPYFIDEIIKLKEKIAATITVQLDEKLLTSDFDMKITISGKQFYELAHVKNFFLELKNAIASFNETYDIVEIQGGCGCSSAVRSWFEKNTNYKVTQRVHPIEAIAEGGIFYLQNPEENIKPPKAWKISYKKKDDVINSSSKEITYEKKKWVIENPGKFYNNEIEDEEEEINEEFDRISLETYRSDGEDNIIFPKKGPVLRNLIKLYPKFPNETKFCTYKMKKPGSVLLYYVDEYGFTKFQCVDAKDTSRSFSDEDAGIDYFLRLSDESIKQSQDKKKVIEAAEEKGDMLEVLKNDFQSFYYSLKSKIRSKKIKGFSDDDYKEAEKIYIEAQEYFEDHEHENNYDDLHERLQYYQDKFNCINCEVSRKNAVIKDQKHEEKINEILASPQYVINKNAKMLNVLAAKIVEPKTRRKAQRRISTSMERFNLPPEGVTDEDVEELSKKENASTPLYFID